MTSTTTPSTNSRPQVPDPKPEVLYVLTGLVIGQVLIARERTVRVRAIYAPNNEPRWRHVALIEDVATKELLTLETGTMVTYIKNELSTPPTSRYWLKYQGQEVWVIYVMRNGQLERYQGGTFRFLDSRATAAVPAVPRGAIEVIGHYALRLNALLADCNDDRFINGDELPEDFMEQLEPLASEFNEIAAACFWHYKR